MKLTPTLPPSPIPGTLAVEGGGPVRARPAPGYGQTMADDELGELERIKQLKARYFRLLDTKQWEELADQVHRGLPHPLRRR